MLHYRACPYGDGSRFGFDVGADEMGHRLSSWLMTQPALLARDWPYDVALLYGADSQANAAMKEEMVANVQEFGRRFTWPRIVAGRRRGPIDEAPLVFPLRHGLTRGRRTDAFRRAPGMLAKEQKIAPHRRALLCPLPAVLLRLVVLRLEAVVPQR